MDFDLGCLLMVYGPSMGFLWGSIGFPMGLGGKISLQQADSSLIIWSLIIPTAG